MQRISPARYSATAIVLHWGIAALLLFQISLGWRLEDLPKGVTQFNGYQLHKSVGIAILLLSVLRVAVRFLKPHPAPVTGNAAAVLLAKAVHVLLYVVMIGGPLSGWIIVSTAKVRLQTMLFGVVPWPDLPVGAGLHEPAEGLHGLLGFVGFLLIVLHVAGALFHHFKRDDILARMMPGAVRSRRALHIAAAIVVAGAFLAMVFGKTMSLGASPPAAPEASAPADEASIAALPEAAPSEVAVPEPSASALAEDEAAKASAWKLDKGGKLDFTADYTGDAINGSFTRWDAAIRFSPEDLPGSSIRVTIDLASADTGDSQRDDMLKSDSFFNVVAHPKAVFTSSSIRQRGTGSYAAAGTLDLHGTKQPLTINFTLKIAGDKASASGQASLRRSSFGVGSAEWAGTDELKDPVGIAFSLKATRAAE